MNQHRGQNRVIGRVQPKQTILSGVFETTDTPDGPFTVITDEAKNVIGAGWVEDPQQILERNSKAWPEIKLQGGKSDAIDAVEAYYSGDLAAVSRTPIVQFGTPQQLTGWHVLREIPAGETLTYTQFAERIGNPNAVRAIASICARNTHALFVPCHRILRSDGSLGGFAWGIAIKENLLARENAMRQRPLF